MLKGKPNQDFLDKLQKNSKLKCLVKNNDITITLEPDITSQINDILSEAIAQNLTVEHVMEKGADLEALFTKETK